MKTNILLATFAAVALVCPAACTDKNDRGDLPDWHKYYEPDTTSSESGSDSTLILYPDRTKYESGADMVLLYGGSQHRSPINWDTSTLRDYVMYTDTASRKHWLFDSFLCLEFMMTHRDVTLVTGYSYGGKYLDSATQEHWGELADYYFKKGYNLDALESAIKACAVYLGDPPSKRKVFIGIPEPIKYRQSYMNTGGTKYWGSIDGEELDFARTSDRLKAIEWYINRVIGNFGAKDYQYIELAGFYWVAEKASNSRDILKSTSEYLHSLNMAFNWIPYFEANGYSEWADFGFDFAYMQPNYFFNDAIQYSRLETACDDVARANMGLEVEFDGNAVASYGGSWGYRLRDYLDAFKNCGAWENSILAYYQGSWALRWMKQSSNTADKELYHYFCDWVISRPIRDSH